MTTVTLYRSTDASAPTLTGQVGSLTTLLDAVLVNGYGTQPAAGWTKPFTTATNQAAYRNSATDGTGFHVNVNDNGPGAGAAREARMTGFETMSALATGTGQFPLLAQLGIGIGAVVCRKSTTADATARPWVIVADNTVFYLFVETGDVAGQVYSVVFGDFFSYKASDAYRCLIIGRMAENNAQAGAEALSALLNGSASFLNNTISGHFVARHWTGVGGSVAVGKHIDQTAGGAAPGSAGGGTSGGTQNNAGGNVNTVCSGLGNNWANQLAFPYPNGPDGGLYISPVWLHHNSARRGYMKGLWAPLHDRPLNHGDSFSGTGNLNGKSFFTQNLLCFGQNQSAIPGNAFLETSSTWS
jgi:hypothetical protein